MTTPHTLKSQLPHTWPLFFTRHGNFTPIQLQTAPAILKGQDVLVMAATASGKTEAVIAPLVERYWQTLRQGKFTILYLCPTRALARDLYERLQQALGQTSITVGLKTGDTGSVRQAPAILLTTPESTDSLLTRQPRMFTQLQAVVIDEVHLFDNTPRGDHLRCLLPRIERIRTYARPAPPMQRVALSATVTNPQGVAERYLHEPHIAQAEGGREILADMHPLYDLIELITALAQRATQKSLIFCNTRDEVEQTAVYLRQHLPHQAEIFVHYSNLDSQMRLEVEQQFASATVAICVCTSTLELGIDIGSIDDVVLLGAPYDATAFQQRIGRGGRRGKTMRVLCLPKSPLEWLRFEALLAIATKKVTIAEVRAYQFRPSVLVQQIFSLLKQSPLGTVRLGDVRRIAPNTVNDSQLHQLLNYLTLEGYLKTGRLGEWLPDAELQELFDRHEIYSNIGGDVLGLTAVNAYTGRVLAQTDTFYPKGTIVLFGGKPMRVVWVEKNRFGLAPAPNQEADEILRYSSSGASVSFPVAQAVARVLGVPPHQMPILLEEGGMWLFHFWGTIWGEMLTAVLQDSGLYATFSHEYALYVESHPQQLPACDLAQLELIAQGIGEKLGARLGNGRFYTLLPPSLAKPALLGQLNLPRLHDAYSKTQLVQLPQLHKTLHDLT